MILDVNGVRFMCRADYVGVWLMVLIIDTRVLLVWLITPLRIGPSHAFTFRSHEQFSHPCIDDQYLYHHELFVPHSHDSSWSSC